MNSGCAAALDRLQDFCFMAIKAANREPCTPPRSTLILTPAFVVYTELGIDPWIQRNTGMLVNTKAILRGRVHQASFISSKALSVSWLSIGSAMWIVTPSPGVSKLCVTVTNRCIQLLLLYLR